VRSLRAAALSAPVEAREEDVLEDDGEEEREVSIQLLEGVYPYMFLNGFYILTNFKLRIRLVHGFGGTERLRSTFNVFG
jgi:hypothetical protein